MSDQLSEFRIATPANMLGHSIREALPIQIAMAISGAIDIPAASANTNIVQHRSEMVRYYIRKSLARSLLA